MKGSRGVNRGSLFIFHHNPSPEEQTNSRIRGSNRNSREPRSSGLGHQSQPGVALVSLARIEAVQTQVLPLNVGISSNNSLRIVLPIRRIRCGFHRLITRSSIAVPCNYGSPSSSTDTDDSAPRCTAVVCAHVHTVATRSTDGYTYIHRANHQHPWTRLHARPWNRSRPTLARESRAEEARRGKQGEVPPGIHTRDTISSGRRRWRCGRGCGATAGSFTGIVARHPCCTCSNPLSPSPTSWRAAPVVLRPAGGLPVQEDRITRSSTFLSRNFSFFGKGRWRIQLFVDDESWTELRESWVNSGSLLAFLLIISDGVFLWMTR